MRIHRLLLLLVVFALVSCTTQRSDPGSMGLASAIHDTVELSATVEFLASEQCEGRLPGSAGHDRARDYLVDRLQRLGLQPAFQTELGQSTYLQPAYENRAFAHNVAAVLPGTGFTNQQEGGLQHEWVVLGAHYDHLGYGGETSREETDERLLHPGANDNASGVAVTLEALKRMTQRPLEGGRGRSLIVIFFTGEEQGLIGSRYFATRLHEAGIEPEQVTAMVNLDMVGRLRSQLLVMGSYSSNGWAEVIDRAVKAEALPRGVVPLSSTTLGYTGLSDQQAFIEQGVPSIHLFTGLTAEYHTSDDIPSNLNYGGMVRIARVTELIVRDLLTREQRLVFQY